MVDVKLEQDRADWRQGEWCLHRLVWADQSDWTGYLWEEETGVKTEGEYSAAARDSLGKLMRFLSFKTCKPILVVAQVKGWIWKWA